MTDEWTLVISVGGERGRRNWLRPRWYIAPGQMLAAASPWPAPMEWRPVPDPDRFCARCGADRTEGGGWSDADGFHCDDCHDLLHPRVPRPRPSRARRWIRALAWRYAEAADSAYWAWCERFGKVIVQEEPPRPAG